MAPRNVEKREEILSVSYKMFSDHTYEKVSLSMIARDAGINKSLLQHYYPQKIEIIKAMLGEILNVSFSYMDQKEKYPYDQEDPFQKISDYNMLFFRGAAQDYNFTRFIMASVSQSELLDTWIDAICQWFERLRRPRNYTYLMLRRALIFSMGGSMHLFLHQNELGIDYRLICRRHIWSILSFLEYAPEEIREICDKTDERILNADVSGFLDYCQEKIHWLEP